jgi:ABC-2 type transport system permease protein
VLGAIAGVMVPRFLMPPGLQTISQWSPMGWALDGMQSVFLAARMPPSCCHGPVIAGVRRVVLLLGWWPLHQSESAR